MSYYAKINIFNEIYFIFTQKFQESVFMIILYDYS